MLILKFINRGVFSLIGFVGSVIGILLRPFFYRFSVSFEYFQIAFFTSYWRGKLSRGIGVTIYPEVRFYRPEHISIGEGSVLHRHILMEVTRGNKDAAPKIVVGKNCHIGEYNHFSSNEYIEIGDGLLTGRYVLITDNSHGLVRGGDKNIPPHERIIVSKGPIVIGKNVWLGDCVAIMANVKIGDGAIVAAHSVVTHDVPPFSLVAGVPARVVKK